MRRCSIQQCSRFGLTPAVILASVPLLGLGCCMAVASLESEFGSRWPQLSAALGKPKRYAAWVNPFAAKGAAHELLTLHGLEPLPGIAGEAHLWAPAQAADQQLLPKPPTCSVTGLKTYYPLDLASAMPVLALLRACASSTPRAALDACAAPGGKFLLMAGAFLGKQRLGLHSPDLVAVESDAFRASRLKQNVRLYLPEVASQRVRVLRADSTRALSQLQAGPFDAVLVDAPCSSERERLLRSLRRGQQDEGWKKTKAEANARRQVSLLSCALQNTLPGGVVVYATCALSQIENDLVVQAVLDDDKRNCLLSVACDVPGVEVESTHHGWRVLPDLPGGWGPLYWAALTRRTLARRY